MTVPEKCDVCLTRHHKHQAHVFAKRDFVVVPVKAAKPVEPHDCLVAASAVACYSKRCDVCGEQFESLRPHAKTCSAKCRQRKRRAARA